MTVFFSFSLHLTMSDLLPLVDFFISFSATIQLEPISSELLLIWHLYCKNNYESDFPDFLEKVQRINEITNGCFPTDSGSIAIDGTLEWINIRKLTQLKDWLTGKGEREPVLKKRAFIEDDQSLSSQSNTEILIKLLNAPVSAPLIEMEKLLTKPTARKELARSKVIVKWPKKNFAQVCKNNSHIQTLSNVIGNGGGNNLMGKLKGKISSTIYQCVLRNVHYLPIITNFTDVLLGDCSYLDTCHRMKTCRYLHYYTLNSVHYEEDKTANSASKLECIANEYTLGDTLLEYERVVPPAQWINCDVRKIPFLILGKFAVIISDPAWDIHMSLPYGTCKDVELLSLPMNELQDEGILLLWVTGRSIETGRKALINWGYAISDEVIWVKLNQLRRTIVTGRTGHWLNHSKEHLLVGVKGGKSPWLNRLVDSSIVVSPTRETLRKPDEIYQIVERIVGKHARKLELFGRDHNCRPGWFTIGDQVLGVSIYEEEVRKKYEGYKNLIENGNNLTS